MSREELRIAGWLRRNQEAGWLAVMLLPGALTLYLGFHSGGFYVGTTSILAAEMALVVGLRFALARRPTQGVGKPLLVAAVAMACFAGWTLLSSGWSDSLSRALPEYSRALLYGLLLLFFGMLPFNPRRIRWMTYGVATAIVVICAAALTARLLPHVIFDPALVGEARLGYPLTYWNALGILGCVGIVLCAHLACSTRDSAAARVLGAAAVPLLALTVFYTVSRGAIWGAPAALVVYAVVGRPRALLSGAIATIPATAIVILEASPASSVGIGYPQAMVSTGQRVAFVLGGCMLGAALVRACLLPLDDWMQGIRLSQRLRGPVLAGAVALGLLLVMAAGTAADVPHLVDKKYHEFTDRVHVSPSSREGESRLLSGRSQGRFDLWDVALDSYRVDRLHGSGAGTYAVAWNKQRPRPTHVENAHSLYLEVLGELGIVGLALLVVVLVLILGAFAFRARGPDRPLFAALLAAGLAWAVHAGVDWDWQMPAVTIWLFAFGGAALARSLQWRRRRSQREMQMALIRAAGVLACLFVAVIPARVAVSQARLSASIDALDEGDCRRAQADANSSLRAVSQRPTPYLVIAYCDLLGGRPGPAAIALQRALQRDPENWELHYDLAVARAGAGLDPMGAARRAAALNPLEELARTAPARFRGRGPEEWQRAGEAAPLLAPELGDP